MGRDQVKTAIDGLNGVLDDPEATLRDLNEAMFQLLIAAPDERETGDCNFNERVAAFGLLKPLQKKLKDLTRVQLGRVEKSTSDMVSLYEREVITATQFKRVLEAYTRLCDQVEDHALKMMGKGVSFSFLAGIMAIVARQGDISEDTAHNLVAEAFRKAPDKPGQEREMEWFGNQLERLIEGASIDASE